MKRISNSESETIEIAKEFSRKLKKGDIILLKGDLGAGKTRFVKGVASGFGISEQEIKSPTFTILNEYIGNNSIRLFHFDFYRIIVENDNFPIFDWDEVKDGISIIEWGDFWSYDYNYEVIIRKISDNKREIVILP